MHLESEFYGYYSSNGIKMYDKGYQFYNYLLIIDAYSKIPKLYGMDIIDTEEVMDKLDMFQSIFGKID